MKSLETAILTKGKVLPGNILKVGAFLNNRIDISLANEMGKAFYKHFADKNVNKILTIEASGIGLACITAQYFNCDVVFAKKSKTANVEGETYTAKSFSYTHKEDNTVIVAKEYLDPNDVVLIIDDFLAHGEATNALMSIVDQAGAKVAGVGIAIEKGFQGAGDRMRNEGIDVCSLAIVDKMDENGIVFRA